MKLKNIDHLVITTSNLEACLHFYVDILGMNHRVVDSQHILEEAGCKIVEGVVEQAGALGLMDSVYMYDPDGSLVEIAVYRKE